MKTLLPNGIKEPWRGLLQPKQQASALHQQVSFLTKENFYFAKEKFYSTTWKHKTQISFTCIKQFISCFQLKIRFN